MSSIEILPVTEVSDAKQLEDVQRQTWHMDEHEILPGRFLHALQHNGACLLAAYDGQKIAGFVFGLLGTVQDLDDRIDQVAAARLQMYSAIMGVLPEYQSRGIGYRLKLAQREFALRIGVRLITWTYDPLESRNAYLNIGKLGVVCHQYFRNYHGELAGLNQGLPTDRFYVEWWVTSNRVKGKLGSKRALLTIDAYRSGGIALINEAKPLGSGFMAPPDNFVVSDNRILLVEFPSQIQEIKNQDMKLAAAWREHTRDLFEHYFEHNYLITDMVRESQPGKPSRSYYVLTFGNG
jgi:predicted GNAT superfamily acetyltransferase